MITNRPGHTLFGSLIVAFLFIALIVIFQGVKNFMSVEEFDSGGDKLELVGTEWRNQVKREIISKAQLDVKCPHKDSNDERPAERPAEPNVTLATARTVSIEDTKNNNLLLPPGTAEKIHKSMALIDNATNVRKRIDAVINYRNGIEIKESCATRSEPNDCQD